MSRPIKIFSKTAVERIRLYISYECWLEDVEKLTGFQVTVNPATAEAPLKINAGYTDVTNKKLVMFVSGGVGNTDYTLQVVVNTDSGQIKRDDLGMRVYP
jgi:hypothetical protein